jgi:hypothetical protein
VITLLIRGDSTLRKIFLSPVWSIHKYLCNVWRFFFIATFAQVLPRQTCGLYTTNLFYESYPGGKARLDAMIKGGELFQTIVANQVNTCWISLQLQTIQLVCSFRFLSLWILQTYSYDSKFYKLILITLNFTNWFLWLKFTNWFLWLNFTNWFLSL